MAAPLAAPLAALLATTLAASPQTDDAQALVSTGDIFPNVWKIDLIRRPAMSDTGQWAAVLDTTNGSFETDSVLFVNGRIPLQESAALASGDVIGNIFGVDFSPNGSIAWTHRVNPGTGRTEERLHIDGVERLRSGGPINGAAIPAGTTLDDVLDLRYDASYELMEVRLHPG